MTVQVFGTVLPAWTVGPLVLLAFVVAAYLTGRVLVKPHVRQVMAERDIHLAKPLSRAAFYLTVLAGLAVGLIVGGYRDVFAVLGTMLAAITVAIGFAMKDTVNAFMAGVFIFIDKPFRIGDWIEWSGNQGIVRDIRLRTTVVDTFDGERLTVPNNNLANTVIKNPVMDNTLRLTVTVELPADVDRDDARSRITDAIRAVDDIAETPAPGVTLTALTQDTATFEATYWLEGPTKEKARTVTDDVVEAVTTAFADRDVPVQAVKGRA